MPKKNTLLQNLQGTLQRGPTHGFPEHLRLCEMPPLANEKRVNLREPLLSHDEGPRLSTNLGGLRPPERSQATLRGRVYIPTVEIRFQKHKIAKKTGKPPSLSKSERYARLFHIIVHQLHIISYRIVSYDVISYRIVSYHIISYQFISHHIISYPYHIHPHHIHIVSIFNSTRKTLWPPKLDPMISTKKCQFHSRLRVTHVLHVPDA